MAIAATGEYNKQSRLCALTQRRPVPVPFRYRPLNKDQVATDRHCLLS
jgi:hypothetical protein